MNYPPLTGEQIDVYEAALEYLDAPHVDEPYFLFEGPAGTGKSFILAAIARARRHARLVALSGKAASVVARRSGMPASTIHSAIYNFRGEFEDEDTGEKLLNFQPKHKAGSWRDRAVLLDESGTVGEQIAQDLINTGCRIVACGDPYQLRPIRDRRFFAEPRFRLTEVRRQAWDSPIIRQAHAVLRGESYQNDGPDFRVSNHVSHEDILWAGAVLCWRNATRRSLNALVRAHYDLPADRLKRGEPVMCLRNNHEIGVLNGAVYELLEDHIPGSGTVAIVNEHGHEILLRQGWVEDMQTPPEKWTVNGSDTPFAIGRCFTVHKFQGSEAENIVFCDEFTRNSSEWISQVYTALTRASKSMLAVPSYS